MHDLRGLCGVRGVRDVHGVNKALTPFATIGQLRRHASKVSDGVVRVKRLRDELHRCVCACLYMPSRVY
jgi:hypothetical protein